MSKKTDNKKEPVQQQLPFDDFVKEAEKCDKEECNCVEENVRGEISKLERKIGDKKFLLDLFTKAGNMALAKLAIHPPHEDDMNVLIDMETNFIYLYLLEKYLKIK